MILPCGRTENVNMLDLIFVGVGLGGFALMGAYAVLCARL